MSETIELKVDLGERSYPIFIGTNLLNKSQYLSPYIRGKQVLVVTNETVAPLYLDTVLEGLGDYQTASVILPDGEQYKTLETLNLIFDALLTNHFDRQATLIALGGGVVGDMTGFAAASYQRGVDFIQIPTTLLAQVDSSVGGKTGVNHPLGKNMIGAFHQPRCVITDTNTLNTLEDRHLSAGIAEVIKYGLINRPDFFLWLEQNVQLLLQRDTQALAYAIHQSCLDKAEIVAADEKEGGCRALLNLGHTFGHAIEAGMGYGEWVHGEAVAVGMSMAADLSQRQGWLDQETVDRIDQLLSQAKLPIHAPKGLSVKNFMDLMTVDKKVHDGKIRFILLKAIGNAIISDDYHPDKLTDTLQQHSQLALT